MDREQHWQEVYSNQDSHELGWFEEHATISLELIEKYLPDMPGDIIDIGGGSSRLVDDLLDAGLIGISLLDISASALEKTKARLAERSGLVSFLLGDIAAWKPEQKYAVWHDRGVFHFLIDEPHRNAYLDAMRRGTHAGSILVMATFAPDGPETCSGLPLQRYSAEDLARVFGEDYALIEQRNVIHETPWHSEQKFIFTVFKRI